MLEAGRVYAIDGGLFRAHYNEERGQFELWTHEGQSGTVIARTGFEIGEGGELYHRVFDFETQEHVIFEAGLNVDELEEVDEAEFQEPVEE